MRIEDHIKIHTVKPLENEILLATVYSKKKDKHVSFI